MKRPLMTAGLLFSAGVWLSGVFAGAALRIAAACAVFAALSLFLYFIILQKRKSNGSADIFSIGKRASVPLAIGAAAMCLGVLWGWNYSRMWTLPAIEHIGEQADVEMLVTDYARESRYGYLVPVELFGVQTALFTSGYQDVRPGDTLAGLVNIGKYAGNGYTVKATQAGELEARRADRIPLTLYPAQMRHELLTRINRIFSRNADFAAALAMGDRSGFSGTFTSALSVTGLSHIVSISGLHISFIAGIFIWVFGGTRRAAPFAIPFIIVFVACVGFPPSAVRAAVMNILMMTATLIKRDYDARVSLSLALSLIVLARPEAAADIGLQLSFAATFGIMTFAGLWSRSVTERLNIKHGFFAGAVRSLSTTAAALVFTVPLTAYHFGTISLVAPISNLLTLPLISVSFVGILIITGISYIFMPLAQTLAMCLEYVFDAIKWFVTTTARFLLAAIYASDTLVVSLLVFQYVILALCFISWRRGGFRPVIPACLSVCALCAVILVNALYYDHSNTMRVTAIDVGQGQSLALSTKSRTLVVDCGGQNAADETLKTVLSQGASAIDVLVLTHCHDDHADGVPDLLERIKVGAIVTFEVSDDITAAAAKTQTPVLLITEDTDIKLGDCDVRLITSRDGADVNERCISVVAEYNGFTMLATGDLSGDSERILMRSAEIPELDLYIAGHHGSKYSTCETLLQYAKPQNAIISVGANSYGHPAAETLSRFAAHGVNVYRTDIHGSVTVTVGGK